MTILTQVQETLKDEIKQAVLKAGVCTEDELPEIVLETPKEKAHGDFATNIAMQLARIAKRAPRQIAEEIVAKLDRKKALIKQIDVAGPGFINFFMDDRYLHDVIPTVLEQGEDYGKTDAGKGTRVQVEFVSMNPTGEPHLGHARGAVFGDVLCNVFEAAGYDVEREYYINDAGNQIDMLALSIEARYFQAFGKDKALPEDGYYGDDIKEIAEEIKAKDGDKWLEADKDERFKYFREYGLNFQLSRIKQILADFRVEFDNWFSETSLYKDGKIEAVLKVLDERGYIYEKDGATWFKSTEFGDDKDRVLIKKDGSYTYLTPDIAYHKDKLDRGFDKIIDVWGADHHGYVPRMRAAIQALGYPEDKFSVSIVQMVNVLEDGEIVRMSKRTGKAITLRELIEDVGVDAVRYFFNMRSNDSHLDFDINLARSQSNENPVYYVQYAHARICTMLKQAEAKGIALADDYDVTLLKTEAEKDLLKQIAAFPEVVAEAAKREAPYRITQYVYDLAAQLHRYYNAEKVINEDDLSLTKARIALMRAVKTTIHNALTLMGVSAPEKM